MHYLSFRLLDLTLLLMLFPFLSPPSGTISLRMFDLGGTDKRPRDKRPQNAKMLLGCQDVLERLRVVLKTVEQIVLYVSYVLVCRPSLFVVYLSSVLVNC